MSYTAPRGLERSIPGHRVVKHETFDRHPNGPHAGKYFITHFHCSCGYEFKGNPRKDGAAGSYVARHWHGHIDSITDETRVIDVGIIHKKYRDTLVQVMTSSRAESEGYKLTPWQRREAFCVVLTTTTLSSGKQTHKVTYAYMDKDDALWKAEDHVKKQEREGYAVDYLREATIQETSQDATARLMELADKALDSEDLHDIEQARAELDLFFKLVPIIEAKRDAVEDLRNRKLLKGAA